MYSNIIKKAIILAVGLVIASSAFAQEQSSSVMRRSSGKDRNAAKQQDGTQVTDRMQRFYQEAPGANVTDADRQYLRIIYRAIDLDQDRNAPLYFPEEPVQGQENLFRIIMRLLADGKIKAYEYLDGREVYTDEYKVKLNELLDRFYIPYTNAKGSTEKNPKVTINENDVPTNEVLSYYIVEHWEYDTRSNRLRPRVDAICPVLHRSGDFGGDALKYPMFWVKMADIRPFLAAQTIFVDDDNNLPTYTYDDFFTLGMYDGKIYKTRNLKNKSMVQMYSNPDDLKKAQDSIQSSLDNFEKKLWVPSREEIIAKNGGAEKLKDSDNATTTPTRSAVRSTKRSTKEKKIKPQKSTSSSSSSSSSATRSVRRRR